MIKITQTMRYEIAWNADLYKLLDDISYAIWRVKNKATSMAYDWQHYSFGYNERFGEYPNEKEVVGVTVGADVYRHTKSLANFVASKLTSAAVKQAVKKFQEMRKDILKGNKTIPAYRRDGSFPVPATAVNNLVRINSKKYEVKLSLLSRDGAKERGTTTQQDVTLKTGAGANHILDRIISGEYKLCDSQIAKRKSKYYLLIAYQFESAGVPTLRKENVMGIDLGIVKAAAMGFNNSPKRYYIEGEEIRHFRAKIEARRNALQRQLKHAGDGRKGRGRKALLKPLEKLHGRVDDFKRTANHRYARRIVDIAIKHECGVIQMEDLSGIADKGDRFLKTWTYDDLQRKIEYKAKAAGIEVRKINPYCTSQRCSRCGHIAKGNRDGKKQAEFKCTACGYETNADYNAAVNIAQPDIEKLIQKELERKKLAAKLAD